MKRSPRTIPAVALLALFASLHAAHAVQNNARPPNFVIVFLDDSGWGDFEPFGSHAYRTPNVDRLARQGCRFNNFYVPQAICSASRAALLSGCYPGRTRVFGAHGPKARGLDPKFATIAEVLKAKGYATGYFGKWHIGDQPDTRPAARGFDESAGLMYSNDMWEFHPTNPQHWSKHPLQFWENNKVTIERVTKEHQPFLTTWYTEHAVEFIRRHAKNGPFFLYVPHSMPHVPLFVSEKFKDKSGAGLYGDVMMEVDWSVGQIMNALEETGADDNTLVLFTSDNGPWISYGNHSGVTPFREAKGTSFDGGIRSACIVKFPGRVPAGTSSSRAFCSIDVLPTFAHLAGAKLTNAVDGRNVWELVRGAPGAENPHEYYPFTTGSRFEGIITGDGRWKLHLPHPYRTLVAPRDDGVPGPYKTARIGRALFDMENDPLETTNVIAKYPDVAARLEAMAERHRTRFFPKRKPPKRKP